MVSPLDILGAATLDGPHGQWRVDGGGDTVTLTAPSWKSVKHAPDLQQVRKLMTHVAKHSGVKVRIVVADAGKLAAEAGHGVTPNLLGRLAGLPEFRIPIWAAFRVLFA